MALGKSACLPSALRTLRWTMDINLLQVGQDIAGIKPANPSHNKDELSEGKIEALDPKKQLDKPKDMTLSADNLIAQQDSDEIRSVDEALTQINDFLHSKSRQLNFSVDDDSGRQVIKVTDARSGDVIRQIPTEEVLKISARIQELQTHLGSAVGLFFDNQV